MNSTLKHEAEKLVGKFIKKEFRQINAFKKQGLSGVKKRELIC